MLMQVQEKDSNGDHHTRSITNGQVSGSAAKAKSKSVAPKAPPKAKALNAKAKIFQTLIAMYCTTVVYESNKQMKEETKHNETFILYQSEVRKFVTKEKNSEWEDMVEFKQGEFSYDQLMLRKGTTMFTAKAVYDKGMSGRAAFTIWTAELKTILLPSLLNLKPIGTEDDEEDGEENTSECEVVTVIGSGKGLEALLENVLMGWYNYRIEKGKTTVTIKDSDEMEGDLEEKDDVNDDLEEEKVTSVDGIPENFFIRSEFSSFLFAKYFFFYPGEKGKKSLGFASLTLASLRRTEHSVSVNDAITGNNCGLSRKKLKDQQAQRNIEARLSSSTLILQEKDDEKAYQNFRLERALKQQDLKDRIGLLNLLKPRYESEGALEEKYYKPLEDIQTEMQTSANEYEKKLKEMEDRKKRRLEAQMEPTTSNKKIKCEGPDEKENKKKSKPANTPSPAVSRRLFSLSNNGMLSSSTTSMSQSE